LNYSKHNFFEFENKHILKSMEDNKLHSFSKYIQNAINHHIIKMNSKTLKQKCYTILITKKYIDSDIQYIIRHKKSTNKT
jgi:hypothetical protein